MKRHCKFGVNKRTHRCLKAKRKKHGGLAGHRRRRRRR